MKRFIILTLLFVIILCLAFAEEGIAIFTYNSALGPLWKTLINQSWTTIILRLESALQDAKDEAILGYYGGTPNR